MTLSRSPRVPGIHIPSGVRAEVQSADAADDGAERVKGEIDGMCFHVGANNKQLETPDFDALLPLPSRHFRRCASASSSTSCLFFDFCTNVASARHASETTATVTYDRMKWLAGAAAFAAVAAAAPQSSVPFSVGVETAWSAPPLLLEIL